MLLRPHSMPGGKFHRLWSPYELYGRVDYNYGWPAYNTSQGFPGAQGWMNALETLAYIYYLVVVYRHGYTATKSGRVSQKRHKKDLMWWLKEEKAVPGRVGATALVIAFAAGIATLSKTVLYCEWCAEPSPVWRASLIYLQLLSNFVTASRTLDTILSPI